jgi:hemerythrin
MAFVVFEEKYRLGNTDIDRQHERLFAAIDQLHDAMLGGRGRRQVGHCVAFLRQYTVEHFAAEEHFMDASAFPTSREHKAQHSAFIRRVQELETQHDSGVATLPVAVLNFLRDWLTHHILEHDKNLARHLETTRG